MKNPAFLSCETLNAKFFVNVKDKIPDLTFPLWEISNKYWVEFNSDCPLIFHNDDCIFECDYARPGEFLKKVNGILTAVAMDS